CGSEVLVGAWLVPPEENGGRWGVIFFNNAGMLGMCGHGTIGVIATLRYLRRIQPGVHRLDTPVGTVACTLANDGMVTIENVPSYRHQQAVTVAVEGYGEVVGDVAWGGNWFFLVDANHLPFGRSDIPDLRDFARSIRDALGKQGITGQDGAAIDHIELFGTPSSANFDSRNFVLCPGGDYDRSPCGTGTSAKVACLADDAKLLEGQRWRQESIVGSCFEASYRRAANGIVPIISGRAYVCGEGSLLLDADDPFKFCIQ
ncbi:MAG: proline racemase family protein, partial [Burkholderiales bacterium]